MPHTHLQYAAASSLSFFFLSPHFMQKHTRLHAVCSGLWQRARQNKAVEIDCSLTELPYGHWIHAGPAGTRTSTSPGLIENNSCFKHNMGRRGAETESDRMVLTKKNKNISLTFSKTLALIAV